MKLIIGLGNPGVKYEYTKHNIGFNVIDNLTNELVKNYSLKNISKFNSLISEIKIGEKKVLLVKPLTYMNLSGEAIIKIVNWYKVDIENIIVIHDDLDLPMGKIRFREKGSAGGHNGIASIIQNLSTDLFKRVKIGIERPKGREVVNHVLTPFSDEDKEYIEESINKVTKALLDWINDTDFLKIMSKYN
ncbi:MAG: aminoacyl-tRNA hydrolase [Vulcanibacillus sp.]